MSALLRRVQRALGSRTPRDLLQETRALVGPRADEWSETAGAALQRLLADPMAVLSPGEHAALSYCIRMTRPAVYVGGAGLGALPAESRPTFPAWDAFRVKVDARLGAVGCLEMLLDPRAFAGPSFQAVGTGFLLSAEVLATNKHVLDALSFGTMTIEPGSVRFDLDRLVDQPGRMDPVPVAGVLAVHPLADLVLLRCDPVDVAPGRQTFAVGEVSVDEDAAVCVLGHPLDDVRSPAFRERVFTRGFGTKCACPGEVIGGTGEILHHDCSTLGGNSGSPVVAMDSGEVVGIHSNGYFLFRNEAVRGATVAEWIGQRLSEA